MFFIVLMLFIGGAFILQIFLGHFQVKHFSNVFVQMRRKGKVAIGRKKGNLRSGTIVFLAIDSQGTILDAKRMQGVTIFAHFHSMDPLMGESIRSIPKDKRDKYNKLVRSAIDDAVNNYMTVARGGTIQENHGTPLAAISLMVHSMFKRKPKTRSDDE